MTAPGSKAQQWAAEARQAAEIRDALTHPDVVALRVERVRARVDRLMWAGIVLGLLFTMVNVQQFAAGHTEPYTLGWWAAWLLDPTVSVILLGVLIAEREAARWQVPMGTWSRVAKWSLLAATYAMNTWQSWAAGDLAGIVLHSVPPLAVFVAAEAVTDCQDKLTECVHRAHTYATQRAEHKAKTEGDHHTAEQARSAPVLVPAAPVPPVIAPPITPVFPVAPDRQGDRSGDRPGTTPTGRVPDRPEPPGPDRSPDRPTGATRTGPQRTRTTRPRTDAQLAQAVRQLAAQTGRTPSQYQLKQRLGVGSDRAARLLAELGDLTPTATPATTGTARMEGTR